MFVKLGSNREVEIISISGAEDDPQIESAVYYDTGEEVTDEDLEEIYTYFPDVLYEMWHDKQISRADAELDRLMDK